MLAVKNERLDLVELFLSHGADPNLYSPQNQTTLHLACMQTSPLIVEALLKYGAKTNLTNSHGLKPVDIAYQFKAKEIVVMLNPKQIH